MESSQKSQIEAYITEKESKDSDNLIDTIANLGLIEQETKDNMLKNWLKNDEKLLSYAELAFNEKLNTKEYIEKWLLELRLSITCPYFRDFKDFLEQLKSWNNISNSPTTAETSVEFSNKTFCGTSLSCIKSEPYQKNSETWVTWCSRTARRNWENFWLKLPSGNAYDAWEKPGDNIIKTIPEDKSNKRPRKSWEWIQVNKFKAIEEWNYADIYTDSKSDYGHRAAAFKDDNGQWYVLDPYTRVNWILDNSPKKLEDYLSVRKIVKAHFYQSNWYRENSSDMHKDAGEWYEWWNP